MVPRTPTEREPMPQSTCPSCTADLYSAARTADLIDPRCPACGASFERARGSGFAGSSQLRSRRPAPPRMASADHRRIAARFGAFMDRSHAGQARLAAQTSADAARGPATVSAPR